MHSHVSSALRAAQLDPGDVLVISPILGEHVNISRALRDAIDKDHVPAGTTIGVEHGLIVARAPSAS